MRQNFPTPTVFSFADDMTLARNIWLGIGYSLVLGFWCVDISFAADPLPADQLEFFEKNIRPVLVERCYKCHSVGAEKLKGKLLLDTREGARKGGETGPAVVPGNVEKSLLIQAIRYTDEDLAMPPKKAGGKLPDNVIKDFEKWIAMGAPDPREGASPAAHTYDTTGAKDWWAFKPLQKQTVPAVKDTGWPRGDIDKFLLAAMDEKGVKPVGDADKLTLLRRVYFDLIGLPPKPSEIETFLKDTSPDAFAKVVDNLLASPRFGERWGRHWLDVARYAESSGKDVNIAFPHAWRYRDYVIAAFNADKPYDQFIREQIAGDLLPVKDDKQRAEQIVATGFLAIGTKSLSQQNPRQYALDLADEQIDATSQAFLGLTIACARCHDHKFDPIPQREYYSVAGIFLSTDTRYGTPLALQNRHASELIELPKSANAPTLGKTITTAERERLTKELADLTKERDELARDVRAERLGGTKTNAPAATTRSSRPGQQANQRVLFLTTRIGQLETYLKTFDDAGNSRALAMGVQDLPVTRDDFGLFRRPRDGENMGEFFRQRLRDRFNRPPEFQQISNSSLYIRGEADQPGDKVPRGFVSVVTPGAAAAIPAGQSGRRELADWIASSQNPLTARVMANRVWYWLFGRGIVTSLDNFGNSGAKPDNPALLDYLAGRLVEQGWSVKKMIREIILSRAYRLASTHNEANFLADPNDALVWHMKKRRLDAECIHDAMLAVSGQLQLTPPVGSAIAQAGDGVIGGPFGRGISEAGVTADVSTRAVYQAIARDLLPDSLDVFDFPDPSLVSGAREVTNVPSQALYLLNSPWVTKQAEAFAELLMKRFPGAATASVTANLDQRVTLAYWLALSRAPTPTERQAANNFFLRFPANWQKGDTKHPAAFTAEDMKAAWTSFCRALFASAEFRMLD